MNQAANPSTESFDETSARAPVPRAAAPSAREIDATLNARLRELKTAQLHESFGEQGSFLYLEDFLPRDYTERLIDAVHAVTPAVNRNYLPGHKQGGSVSRHAIDRLAPFIAELYRSQALVKWLEAISGRHAAALARRRSACLRALFLHPSGRPHRLALRHVLLRRPPLHAAARRDRRFVLPSRLRTAHAQRRGAATQPGSVQYPPGGLVFFDGDKLRHRITPLGANEMRVSLTFEYVTNPNMRPWWRFISNMKDAIAYFGFRQVFRRKAGKNGSA